MAEILDKKLPEVPSGQVNGLLVDPRRAVLPGGDIQFDDLPSRTWQQDDLLQQFGRPSSQRKESNLHTVQTGQVGVGRQTRIEHQVAWVVAAHAFPELQESENLIRFLSFPNVGIGIAESSPVGILRQKHQDAGLAPAACRHVMAVTVLSMNQLVEDTVVADARTSM